MQAQRMSAEERRSQILDAALHLFARRGYERVTMKGVAASCGITEPALYRHFSSKQALYESVLLALRERLQGESPGAQIEGTDDIEGDLGLLARAMVSTLSGSPELLRLLLLSALEGHPLARRIYRELRLPYMELLCRRLDDWHARGRIRSLPSKITARCFVGMVMDELVNSTLLDEPGGASPDIDSVIRNNVSVYALGIRQL